MNRRWVLVILWAVALLAYTVASGFTLPPQEGVASTQESTGLGASQLEQLLGATAGGPQLYSLSPGLAVQGGTDLLVIAAPERAPYPTEDDALDTFMEQGGTMIVFATSTVWNGYLSQHGITLHGELLIPPSNATSERLIQVSLPQDLSGGQLFLPNATAITDPGPGVTTVTPEQDLVLDIDGNGTVEVPPDRAGTFPVVAATPVGDGQLIVVGSIEAVLGPGLDRNLDPLTRLVRATGATGPAAIDEGTHPRGMRDLARAPAQASLALAHWSPVSLVVLLLATAGLGLQIKGRGGETEGQDLDEVTPQTREVTRSADDR